MRHLTIKRLAKELTDKYGRGFKKSNLYTFVSFYQNHTDFFQPLTGKSLDMTNENIFQSLTGKCPIRLSWTHYSIIMQESTAEGRSWYEQEASNEMWSTRTLQHNVSSQYYHRLLQSQDKTIVHNEMVKKTSPGNRTAKGVFPTSKEGLTLYRVNAQSIDNLSIFFRTTKDSSPSERKTL
ncbi:MAG: hypothetical protein J6L60_08410 [Bacteroidaceae bacterium]|nr:hypothetical protein [Bacteroidaceae bacterium]